MKILTLARGIFNNLFSLDLSLPYHNHSHPFHSHWNLPLHMSAAQCLRTALELEEVRVGTGNKENKQLTTIPQPSFREPPCVNGSELGHTFDDDRLESR